MATHIQAVRGMNDILPAQAGAWQYLERTLLGVLRQYSYQEIRLPLLEKTELFERSIGEVTDIVEKEMYSFQDRNGDSLTLRPEGTAGCVRAGIEHGLLHNQVQRVWYQGSMFRHERPQKGRYRQFHQVGVEAFGLAGPDVDAELILMSARMWRALGLDGLVLELNSLGTPESRAAYRAELVSYLKDHYDNLDDDGRRRLQTNPLRVLDSKDPAMQALINGAPVLTEHLDAASREHFAGLTSLLDQAGLAYRLNPRLVRGLDYYTRTVFEWVTERLGAQGTVCAGGRFDKLVAQLGGRATPAAGFALGMERLVALLEEEGGADYDTDPHAYLVLMGAEAADAGLALAERLRNALPALRLKTHCGGGSVKAQFKQADRSGAQVALILGAEEIAAKRAGVKPLRGNQAQRSVPWDGLADVLRGVIEPKPAETSS